MVLDGSNKRSGMKCGAENVANLMLLNNDLDTFWYRWESIVAQLPPDSIQSKGLETMLYGKIRKHPDLAQPIKDYERAASTPDIKNYEWLPVNLDRMHRNYQDRDDRMKEVVTGKTLKVALVKEDDKKNKKDKADKKEKKDRKDPPDPPTVAPSKGEKGDKGGKSG